MYIDVHKQSFRTSQHGDCQVLEGLLREQVPGGHQKGFVPVMRNFRSKFPTEICDRNLRAKISTETFD